MKNQSKMSLSLAAAVVYLICGFYLPEVRAQTNDLCKNFTFLENSLFQSQANKLKLSVTFFPLQDNPPEFLEVTYIFGDGNTQVWYWSAQTSHFLHPFEIFQYMSLFFSKPEPYYTGKLTLTLRPECADAGKLQSGYPLLQVLTQRLKLYAEKGSTSITVSDTYSAKAYNTETLMDLLQNDAKYTTKIIISTAVLVVCLPFGVILVTLCAFCFSKSHTESKWKKTVKKNQPAVLSFTCLSLILNAYILCLASVADRFWNDSNKRKLFDSKSFTEHNSHPINFLVAVDAIFFIFWFLVVLVAVCYKIHYVKTHPTPPPPEALTPPGGPTIQGSPDGIPPQDASDGVPQQDTNDDNTLLILSFTVLCPVFCVIAHSPYIAIAYLNDGSHASSIFIYYTILCFIFFGLMMLFFNWCEQYTLQSTGQENETEKKKAEAIKDGWIYKCFTSILKKCTAGGNSNDIECFGCNTGCKLEKCTYNCGRYCCILPLLGVAVLFLFGLVVTLTCYFVLIPINKAISDAPNRLVSIYQSGGFLIGSFIVYKVIKYFYSKKENEVTLKDINNKLDDLKKVLPQNESNTNNQVASSTTAQQQQIHQLGLKRSQ